MMGGAFAEFPRQGLLFSFIGPKLVEDIFQVHFHVTLLDSRGG